MKNRFARIFSTSLAILILVFLSGCATTSDLADERDPWEGMNRNIYAFNETADTAIFNPIGKVYNTITPDMLDTYVSNFFSNIGQLSNIANDILQLKPDKAVNDTVRFMINSIFGVFGFLDILSSDLPSGGEDFGQTLAYWDVGPGPYVVVPFFGPGTVRDAGGFVIDTVVFNPISYRKSDKLRASVLSLNFVDSKSDLLSASDLLGDAAVDEYEFTKNAFFERRANQINDGAIIDFPED